MTCQSCVDSISRTLTAISGIERFDINLEDKTVVVQGTASPAATAEALQNSGRTAIIRGLGDAESAAVCILEKHDPSDSNMNVFGLARFVEASPTLTLCDLTLKGLPQGVYEAFIHATGDVRDGMHTAGPVWERGSIGSVEVNEYGKGQRLLEKQDARVWELIGRALVVKMKSERTEHISGVVARSAGLWQNQKYASKSIGDPLMLIVTREVCTCSGQSVWDERQEMLKNASTL